MAFRSRPPQTQNSEPTADSRTAINRSGIVCERAGTAPAARATETGSENPAVSAVAVGWKLH